MQELGLAANAVMKDKYLVGSSSNTLYPSAGSSDDWFMGVANVSLAYTIELPGSSFIYPPRKILETVIDTFKAIYVFADYIRNKK